MAETRPPLVGDLHHFVIPGAPASLDLNDCLAARKERMDLTNLFVIRSRRNHCSLPAVIPLADSCWLDAFLRHLYAQRADELSARMRIRPCESRSRTELGVMSTTRAPLTSSPGPTILLSMIASFRSGE